MFDFQLRLAFEVRLAGRRIVDPPSELELDPLVRGRVSLAASGTSAASIDKFATARS